MELGSFSSLFEIGAAFSATFTVLGYTNSYPAILSEKVFRYPSLVKSMVEQCKKHIDVETIDSLHGVDIKGKNSKPRVVSAQRAKENLLKKIDETKEKAKEEISKLCNAKGFSFISLYCLMYCITMLFLGGLEKGNFLNFFHLLIFILSLLLISIGWCRGEKENQYRWLNFGSLRQSISYFACITAVSVVLASLLVFKWKFVLLDLIADITVICSVWLPFLNFIVYAIVLLRKNKTVKKTIHELFTPVEEECKLLEKEVNELSTIENYDINK